jgi:hypothetical protein
VSYIERSIPGDAGSAIERRIAGLPQGIRDGINRARVAQGLLPIHPTAARRAIFATPDAVAGVAWAPPRVTRVIAIAAYGEAAPRSTGRSRPEKILHHAFGMADDLNGETGWSLRDGHEGPLLAARGERLRAIDTPAGLAIEWLPAPGDEQIIRRIEAGADAVSCCFAHATRRLVRGLDLVVAAKLVHVAILPAEDRAAYPGAVARVFRNRPSGDAELRRQIEAVVSAARWRAH